MKRKLKVASSKHWRDVSNNHYTTMGFGDLVPTFCDEVEPGAKVKINLSAFLRSTQSELPNMGKLSIVSRCFYVPFASVWEHFEDYMQGNAVYVSSWDSSKVVFKECPSLTSYDFNHLFALGQNVLGYELAIPASDHTSFDFYQPALKDDSVFSVERYWKLTKHGKQVLRVFNALGYNFNFGDYDTIRVSALPLLAFFKVIYDYYIPANLRPSSRIDTGLSWIAKYIEPSTGICHIPVLNWKYFFADYLLYYDNNYFTSQWLYPTKPVDGINNFETILTNSIYSQSSAGGSYNLKTAPVQVDDNNIKSADIIDSVTAEQNIMLQSLRKFIIRNNLVGSRPIQRLFARFGVHVPELQLQMARYCGSGSFDIQNYDVTGTSESNLGKLAGQSTITDNANKEFSVNCEQFGMVFVLSSIDVPSTYVDGIRRRNMHLKPFDFFTPEFANGTLQATSGRELFGKLKLMNSNISTFLEHTGLRMKDIFGFSERYSEYCQQIDTVSGDYDVPTLRENIDGYILPRRLYNDIKFIEDVKADDNASSANIKNYGYNSAFLLEHKITPVDVMSQDDCIQFNRIYLDIHGIADPFNVHFHNEVKIHGNVTPSELSQFVAGEGDEFETEKNGSHMD